MARSTAEIELVALVGEATKSIQSFAKDTQRQLDGINFKTTVSAINDGLTLVQRTAGAAFSAVSSVLKDAVSEASAAEDAITGLTNALRLQNDFSDDAVKSFQAYAEELQNVTVFSDEAVLNSVALAKQFKATNEEAKRVVSVAADLAAITGKDLNEATFQVAQTLNGFVDKSLAKAIPGLKNLSKEALINGDAIAIIKQRVDGSAEALANTFSGSLAKAKNAFSDLFETVGEFITKNPLVLNAIRAISDAFKQFNNELKANSNEINKFVGEGFVSIVKATPAIIDSLRAVDAIISNVVIGFISAGRAIGFLGAAIQSFKDGEKGVGKQLFEAFQNDVANDFANNSKRIEVLYGNLSRAATLAATAVEKATEKKNAALKNVGKSTSGSESRKNDLTEQLDQEAKILSDKLRKNIEDATKDPIKALVDLKFNIDTKTGVAIGAGLVQNILKGAKGAQDLISNVIGAAADKLIPGIGGAVKEIVGVLAQGPAEVKKQVEEFARAIPTIIENIIKSLPVLIEALARELPPALARAMPFVAERFSIELVRNIPRIVAGFAQGLIEAAKEFGRTVIDTVKSAGGLLDPISGKNSGGIFSGIPVLGGIGDLFGFAEGGRVPNSPQFKGDKFPARLNAGEQVFSSDLTSRLESFLNGQSNGGQPLVVNVVVGQQQLARAILDLNRGGFRVGV